MLKVIDIQTNTMGKATCCQNKFPCQQFEIKPPFQHVHNPSLASLIKRVAPNVLVHTRISTRALNRNYSVDLRFHRVISDLPGRCAINLPFIPAPY